MADRGHFRMRSSPRFSRTLLRATVLVTLLLGSDWLVAIHAATWTWRYQPGDSARIQGFATAGPSFLGGESLRTDGRTTIVSVRAADVPTLGGGFSIEAWVAPQEYSWNRTAIANHGAAEAAGFFLGFNDVGAVVFSVATTAGWQTLTTTERLPLLRWSHVAARYVPGETLQVFVNGRDAGGASAPGEYRAPPGDLWIGANQELMGVSNTEREPSRQALAATRHVWDGLIDAVRIDAPARAADALRATAAAVVNAAAPLTLRRLPAGPAEARTFGAFYEQLAYDPGWDAQWRSAAPDVVVAFDFAPVRLVSWRGVSYNPCWVTENGNWFSNEFMERWIDQAGCAESMSDKQARFSSVRILESHPARAVIHWRNAPVDIFYRIPFPDAVTGWGDWSDEFYTVYPDGVAVRKFVGWTHVPRGKAFWEWSQSLPILQPGQRPEDVLQEAPFVTLAHLDGRVQDYRWPPAKADPELPGASVLLVNYRSEYKPFLILTDRSPRIWLPRFKERPTGTVVDGMSMPTESAFWWWNHWPVAQLPSDGRVATAADKPSHSWAANQDSAPWESTASSETQLMLCGVTRESAAGLVKLGRSWMRAPELAVAGDGFVSAGYDAMQRAYVVRPAGTVGDRRPLRLTLRGSATSPVVRPAFVLEGWGEGAAEVTVRNQPGVRVRIGYERKLTRTDLVVWADIEATSRTEILVAPVAAKN